MPVKEYEPGTPAWVDLLSSDMEAATRFYTGLFGWGTSDMPMPDGGIYRMFRKGDHDIAGLGQQGRDMTERGMPSIWTLYIGGVVDQAAERAREAGGQIAVGPDDVGDSGRLAVLVDPGGAGVGVWEPNQHRGFTLAGEPGTLVWAEVNTRAFDQCLRFYQDVFGWGVEDVPMPATRYAVWTHGKDRVGGMLQMDDEQWRDVPAHWMLYFGVEDTDAAAARARELGGTVQAPPFDTPYGRVSVLRDPTGAVLSVIRPTEQRP